MRVDLTTFGVEPPDNGKSGRAAGTTESVGGNTSTNTSGSSSASAATNAALDAARFSFDHTRVQSLAAQALDQPEVREAKVQSLKQSIDKREYAVSPGQIADALASDLGFEARA
jgi:flagellar biosynthesis anti-sigma factor FlgM